MTNIDSHRAKNVLIAIVLVLFTSLVAPKLPHSVTKYLENPIIKIGLFLMIAYLATKDLPTAIIAVIAVLVSYQTLSVHKITDTVIKKTQEIINHTQNNHVDSHLGNAHNINNDFHNYNNHPMVNNNKEFDNKLMVIETPTVVTPSPHDNITTNKKLMTKMLKGNIDNVQYDIQCENNFDLVNGDINTTTNSMAKEIKSSYKCDNNPNIIDDNAYDKDFSEHLQL